MKTPTPATLNKTQASLSVSICFMMLSVVLYASQDVLVKILPSDISVIQIIFFRSLFGGIPIAIIGYWEGYNQMFSKERLGLQLLRSVFSLLALFFFVSAFRLIPLAEAYTLTFSCPLFMGILCIPLLKETLTWHRVLAIIIGFGGVLITMRPSSAVFDWGGWLALAGGFFYALSLILVRELSTTTSNTAIVFSFTLLSIIISGLALPFVWAPMSLPLWALMIGIGILGGSAQYAMTQAFRCAPVSTLAPFDYTALLWALAFGYLFFGEIPDRWAIVGAMLIITCGLYVIRTEHFRADALSVKVLKRV